MQTVQISYGHTLDGCPNSGKTFTKEFELDENGFYNLVHPICGSCGCAARMMSKAEPAEFPRSKGSW